jgi:transcriptional regulator with XRE-family HTH domain
MSIGRKLKEFRKARGMTLVELSQKSGVQIASLSRMENMKMAGTLESHINICQALGIDITDLYHNIEKEHQRALLEKPKKTLDIFVHNDKSSYEILTTQILSKRMMPILLKIEPGGQTNTEQGPPGAEKFVFVLEGTITLKVGEKSFPLNANSSLYLDSSDEHSMANAGSTVAKVLVVGTPVQL